VRITLVAVGRAKSDAVAALYGDFAKRLRWPCQLQEIDLRTKLPTSARKTREGERLLAAVPRGARLVALDERESGSIVRPSPPSSGAGRMTDWAISRL